MGSGTTRAAAPYLALRENTMRLDAPYPYFGGKSRIASVVWQRFGRVDRYIEPFLGSGAVLLAHPHWRDTREVVNDRNHYIANVWRAIRNAPDEVAYWCDYPTIEIELHLWHLWLVNEGRERIRACEWDARHYDAEVAGKWLYGMAHWIGGNFAIGTGGWTASELRLGNLFNYDLRAVKASAEATNSGQGVSRQMPNWAFQQGIRRRRLRRSESADEMDTAGDVFPHNTNLYAYIRTLSQRFRDVSVCCGDWTRVVEPAVRSADRQSCAILLDPPYTDALRSDSVYSTDDLTIAHDVRAWCVEHGQNRNLRIALCGYDIEHGALEEHGWSVYRWSANGGYANYGRRENENKRRETVWFSPHCENPAPTLFDSIGQDSD